jgi:hypothetical protein
VELSLAGKVSPANSSTQGSAQVVKVLQVPNEYWRGLGDFLGGVAGRDVRKRIDREGREGIG